MSASLPSLPIYAEFPRRIGCLTDETTEILYMLGEQDRIVGVSGYAHRPPEARSKPRVAAFRDANFKAILDLKPDLILTFSDVQAEITRELVLRGATVMNFNQRSIAEILDMIVVLSRMVGRPEAGGWTGSDRKAAARPRGDSSVGKIVPAPAASLLRGMG
jgi:iron complex transport system substrate-binding protein